jgi:hypothetical protein
MENINTFQMKLLKYMKNIQHLSKLSTPDPFEIILKRYESEFAETNCLGKTLQDKVEDAYRSAA